MEPAPVPHIVEGNAELMERMKARPRKQNNSIFLLLFMAISSLFLTHQYIEFTPYSDSTSTSNRNDQSETLEPLMMSLPLIDNVTSPPRKQNTPSLFSNRHIATRYPRSPFLHSEGYQPTGGRLPLDPADYLMNPRMWRFVDNNTCLNEDVEPEPWQYRAPYAILLGAMKAGTHAVIESLWDHPWVVRTGHWELHFFNSQKAIRNDKGIHRSVTLRNYAQAVRKALVSNTSVEASFLENRHMMIESTPKYILNSDRIPELILCVSPWVKFLVILRNPIARAESHYRFLDESRKAANLPMVDWHEWINDDLRLLSGVLKATTRKEEYEEWKIYQRRPNSQQIVGRGLYIISLEDYLHTMNRRNKPRSDLWVIQSERFLKYRQKEYDKLLNFLELPPHTLINSSAPIHKTAGGAIPMPHPIRNLLRTLYRPYNARLYKLLEWDNVWD